MKQIAYLSMVFLPASFVAVRLFFFFQAKFRTYLIINIIECFRDERARDRTKY